MILTRIRTWHRKRRARHLLANVTRKMGQALAEQARTGHLHPPAAIAAAAQAESDRAALRAVCRDETMYEHALAAAESRGWSVQQMTEAITLGWDVPEPRYPRRGGIIPPPGPILDPDRPTWRQPWPPTLDETRHDRGPRPGDPGMCTYPPTRKDAAMTQAATECPEPIEDTTYNDLPDRHWVCGCGQCPEPEQPTPSADA